MARIRTIKPEFWTSEQVMECSSTARLMFIGIWNFCDDAGRMPFSVKQIKARLFPSDDISSSNIRSMIDELVTNKLVVIYVVEDKEFLQVTGWHHQKIDRPNPSKYPGPNGKDHQVLDEQSRKNSPEGKGKEGSLREGKGREKKERGFANANPSRARDPPRIFEDWPADYRERFWKVYTHRVGMRGAERAIDKLAKARTVSFEWLLQRIAAYFRNNPPDRHLLNPETYLEEERFYDQPAAAVTNGQHERRHVADELAEEARRLEGASSGEAVSVGGAELGGDHAQVVSSRKPT